jgi:hypothetical protein
MGNDDFNTIPPRKWREKLSPPGIYLIGIFSGFLEF